METNKTSNSSNQPSSDELDDSIIPKEETMDATTTISDEQQQQQQTLDDDTYLTISYSGHHSQHNLLEDCKTTASLITSKELNDTLPFFHETLELSQEDIQKTLSANMPLGRNAETSGSEPVIDNDHDTDEINAINAINGEINPMDFIDNVTSGVDVPSVHDDDVFVNLDAFDMFVEFPELDLDAKNTLLHANSDMDIVNDVQAFHQSNLNGGQTVSASISNEFDGQVVQQTTQSASDLFDITDYSPEWAYPEGGIKVLVTGPWDLNSNYTVLFDSFPVPTTVVQTGVLRCYCPAHEVGLATLQVACDGFVISNSCIFEYKSPSNVESGAASEGTTNITTGGSDNMYKLNLYNRLECIDERLQIKMEPSDSVSYSRCLL